ncbi:MAG: T9SS type A sorting domain-containing protein [Ferruginibacter sp.]
MIFYIGLSQVSGQALTEDFNYSGTLLTNGWVNISASGTNTLTTASITGLAYANSPASGVGNAVSMTTSGEDDAKTFTPTVSSGTIYASFLINVTAAQATGDYFLALANSGSNFNGRVFIKSSGAGFLLGVSKFSTTATYDATVRSFGTTYLVVLKYTIVGTNTAATKDDITDLFIVPALGGTEPSPTLANVGVGVDADIFGSAIFDRVALRQGTAAQAPALKVDGIRVGITWASVTASVPVTVNGSIGSGEYGTHTDGQNQNTNVANVTYMTWDNANLYVAVSGANVAEGYILFLDKDPQVPVDAGSNSNGTNIGQNYDGTNFAGLPYRADLVIYVKSGYREYRTATGSNTWTAATTSFGGYAESGSVREFAIPWSVIGGRPASFNFFGYNTSAGGFIYNTQPTANATGALGTSIRYERYYTVSTTTVGSSTPPFSRNSFVFNNTADENSFGSISVYDFTMNSTGRLISRSGATTGNWSIAGNMVVGNGTIFFGSGGTNGAYGSTTVTGDLDIRGGTLDMDQTTSPLTVNGNLALSSGTLKLSGNAFTGGDLVLKGNWTNTGGTFTPQSRAVFLNAASGNQTISKLGGEIFDYLIVDKSAGSVVLANDITVAQIITLTNGTVNTAANKVILSSNATGALSRTNGYVNGNLQRAIAMGTNTYSYAVGTATGYTPASFAFTGVGTGGDITLSSTDGVSANYPAALHTTKRLARYWTATNNAVAGFGGNATFTYLPGDLVGGTTSGALKAYDYTGSYNYPTSNTNTSSSFTFNGLTTFGEFGAGECKGTLAPSITKTMVSSCGGGADGTISVTAAGGTAPYSYTWSSNPAGFSGNTAMVTGLTPRDYTVVVSEVTTCSTGIPDITIYQVFAAVVTNNGGGSSSCGNTGYILLYGSGGVQPYTYSINGTNYFASNSFTGLAAGTYTGYVKDFAGCVSTKPNIVVSGAAPMNVTANTRPASSCADNGVIELYRTGGVAPYTYSMDDVTYQGSNVFNNLVGNASYTGWVKDASGCKQSLANIAVGKAPAITVSATATNTGSCSNTGRIQIMAGGGVPGYTYSLNNITYQAGNTFTGLAAGSYNAYVKDSKNCMNVQSGVTVGTDPAPTINVTASTTNASSCANTGSIQLFRSGGTGPYTYSLDNITYQASNTFTGLAAGSYTGWVKDVNGCTGSLAGITVGQAPAVTATESHTNTSSCANDGTIQLNAGAGVPGYTYSLDNITYQAGNTFTGKAAGNYTGWVKDSKGCTASVPVTIGTTAAINVTAYATAAGNCETNNGSIQLFRTGGTGPYTYSLDNITYQPSNVFSGKMPGTYDGYVKDSKTCLGVLNGIVVGPSCPPPTAGNTKINSVKVYVNNVITAEAYPNPSNTEFTLVLKSNSKEKVAILVTDIMGRKVYQAEGTAGKTYRFGNSFNAGIYMVQVMQGTNTQSIKLIKE